MKNEIPLFPVASITTGIVQAYGVVLMKLDFLTHAMQIPAEAQPGRTYALTPTQARALVQQIETALHQLESAGFQPPPGARM